MATEEAKPEAKEAEHKKAQEAISHDQDNDLPPLPYKTCNLRVSIHCEGCKRKVKKILTNIEGVCAVDVDLKQQKVTVKGVVSPGILIKKLLKAGKNAELLPEKPDPTEKKPGHNPNPKNKEKKKDEDNPTTNTKRNDDGATTSGDRNAAGFCAGKKPVTAKNSGAENAVSGGGDNAGKGNQGGDEADKAAGGGKSGVAGGLVEEKAEIKEAPTGSAGSQPPAADGAADVDKKVEAGGSGSVGRKKKKKGQKGNNGQKTVDGQGSIDTQANTGSSPSVVAPSAPHPTANQDRPSHQQPSSNNHSPPRHQEYPYPQNIYAPPPPMPMPPAPVYGLSYNMAQPPASVYGASYYSAPPPYSYAYMHQGFPPSDQNPYGSRPSDSFEYFSDENPNACSVM